jgi:transglutaminase/protease-like cytokinesis protein 3
MQFFNYFALLLFFSVASSQVPLQKPDYTNIDATARNVQYKGDLKILVSDLTKNYSTEPEKARAIFIWITDNIAYDVKTFNKHKSRGFKCHGKDCSKKYLEWEDKLLEKTLSKKMAVCEGYARLFKRMCDYAGLRTDVVSGYTKDKPSDIGRMGELNHAWNGIILDGEYYYLDVTWASGGCTVGKKGKLENFHKDYNNYYWLTPANKFFRDHFPQDPKLPHIMVNSRQKYLDAPYIPTQHMDEITVISPSTGLVVVQVGDTIHFEIETKNILWNKLKLFTNLTNLPARTDDIFDQWMEKFNKNPDVPYSMQDDKYIFSYILQSKNVRYIDVYFDYRHMVRFKVRVKAEKN